MIKDLSDIPYSIYNQNVLKMDEIPNLEQKKTSTEERDISKVTMDAQDPQLLKVTMMLHMTSFLMRTLWNNLLTAASAPLIIFCQSLVCFFYFLSISSPPLKLFNYLTNFKPTLLKACT